MEVNFSKLAGGVSGIVALGLIGFTAYFTFTLFFDGVEDAPAPTLATVNAGLFGSKVQEVASALTDQKRKIALDKKKDLQFIDSALYKSFVDLPEDVPLSDSRGRPDPFIPYVAP